VGGFIEKPHQMRIATYRRTHCLHTQSKRCVKSPPPLLKIQTRRNNVQTFSHTATTDRSGVFIPPSHPPKPLSIEISNPMRRLINEEWYFKNKLNFTNNHAYNMKFVLIDNGEVMTTLDDFMDAVHYQRAHPECFLTLVGDEDFGSRVYNQRQGEYNGDFHNQDEIFIMDVDIPHKLYDDPVPRTSIVRCSKFYGLSKRPYIRVGIVLPTTPSMVIPIWFLVDTGSPFTFIEKNTAKQLLGYNPIKEFDVEFSDFKLVPQAQIRVSHSHFSKVNLLGTDILWDGELKVNYKTRNIMLDL